MLKTLSLTENFPRDVITTMNEDESSEKESVNQEKKIGLSYLSKLPVSKSIRKEKIYTNIRDVKSVVFIKKEKQHTKKLSSDSIKSLEFERNYLQHTKNCQNKQIDQVKCMGVMKHLSETQMDKFQPFNFQTEMERTRGVSSKHLVLKSDDSFEKTNDITTTYFNPVIHTIENYMTKKENKRCGDPTKQNPQRLSFLSIRNIWTNNNPLNLRGLQPQASEQQPQSIGAPVNSNNQPNQVITQDRHENNDILRGASSITGYPSPNISQDMQSINTHAYLRQQMNQYQNSSSPNANIQQPSSIYNNSEDSRHLLMQNQEQL